MLSRLSLVPVVALAALTTSCYLFSDEPKVRKQAEDGAADGASTHGDRAEAKSTAAPEPTPAETSGDPSCPKLLVGVEHEARTIGPACGPITVRGAYRIEGGSLTLEAGAELRFEPGAALEVARDGAGTLTLAGTAEAPVRLVPATEGSPWTGVRLYAGASGSRLSHAEIVGAGTEARAALTIDTAEAEIESLRLAGATALALELSDETGGPQLLGTTIEGTGVVARATPRAAAGLLDLHLDPGARIAVSAGDIRLPIEWPANPYELEGTIRVSGNDDPERPAQLSLAPGTSLAFGPDARLLVGGLSPGILAASASPLTPTPNLGGGPERAPLPELPDLAPDPNVPADPPSDPSALDPALASGIRLHALADPRPGAWAGIHVQAGGQLILRNVEIAHGGSRDQGVILAEADAKLSVEGCRFEANAVGIELRDPKVEVGTLDGNEFVATPVALRTVPDLRARFGPGNRFDAAASIQIERGRVEASATWDASVVEHRVRGDVYVDSGATLTLTPGSRLSFLPGVVLGVGYYAEATVDFRGRADAKIVLGPAEFDGVSEGEPTPPKPWSGIVLGNHAHKARFEHLVLRAAGGAAGIELRDSADATLVEVDCAECPGATVKWDCESTIGNISVSASEGTAAALAAPSGCK